MDLCLTVKILLCVGVEILLLRYAQVFMICLMLIIYDGYGIRHYSFIFGRLV